jgi:nitrilase
MIERASDRSGHSLYCSAQYINAKGELAATHRKLMPTYEERLVWANGDGHGLKVHSCGPFHLGVLNCWENWMPLSRTALYAQGKNLHLALWPGNVRNTEQITRFIAQESRSYVCSVGSTFSVESIRESNIDSTLKSKLQEILKDVKADGGSCIANPDGTWLLEPQAESDQIFYAELDRNEVYKERQNFDPAGHYSRPDVTQLVLNSERQSLMKAKQQND